MKRLAQFAIALLLCGAVAPAAVINLTPLPGVINPGDTFDMYIGIDPDGAEITAFSVDLYYSADLTPGTPMELGFFLANGVFFSWTPGAGSLNAISDAASGSPGLTVAELVVRIPFTALNASQVTTFVSIDTGTSFLLDPDFMNVPFTAGTTAAPIPEPSTYGVAGAALAAFYAARRRRL